MCFSDFKTVVFPKPQMCDLTGGLITIGAKGICRCCLPAYEGTGPLAGEGIKLLCSKISEKTGVSPQFISKSDTCSGMLPVKIEIADNCLSMPDVGPESPEGYKICAGSSAITISAGSDKGIFYGLQTLCQMLRWDGYELTLPRGVVEDWPDMKYRGLYMEDKWGTDRMKLEDWKDVIDYMSLLKMNFLNIALYGCWVIQYSNEITEFNFVPFSRYPEIKSPKTIRYYSPSKAGWVTLDYLPEMFAGDFFGEIINYGRSRNVLVSPLFNSLGHNTMLPGLYPETAARDLKGKPTGYGFFTSNDKTYELLFNIYDEIIDRYLKPNDINWFAIGMDEVWKSIGIDPEDPYREFDPWCKCGQCSMHSHEELFMEHIIRLAKHLKAKGMKSICMFHDQLDTMNLTDGEFVNRLKREDLYELMVIDWWKYDMEAFDTLKPKLGLRTFVMPMAGYYAWMLTDSYLVNIYNMMKLGHKEKVEGTKAYCVFDYSYDRNYHCLSEYMWNNSNTGDLTEFRNRYLSKYFGNDYEMANETFKCYDRLIEPGSEGHDLIFYTLNYYFYTYTRENRDYPRNYPGEAFDEIYNDIGKYRALLKDVYADADRAYRLFDEFHSTLKYDGRLVEHCMVESLHYRVLAGEFLKLIDINDRYNSSEFVNKPVCEKLEDIWKFRQEIAGLKHEREALMLLAERTKSHYWVPSLARNMSIYREYLSDIEAFMNGVYKGLTDNHNMVLPALQLKDTRNLEGDMYKILR